MVAHVDKVCWQQVGMMCLWQFCGCASYVPVTPCTLHQDKIKTFPFLFTTVDQVSSVSAVAEAQADVPATPPAELPSASLSSASAESPLPSVPDTPTASASSGSAHTSWEEGGGREQDVVCTHSALEWKINCVSSWHSHLCRSIAPCKYFMTNVYTT